VPLLLLLLLLLLLKGFNLIIMLERTAAPQPMQLTFESPI
jgi:hypothetical protein